METECYPITTLPGTTALFRDFTEPRAAADPAALRRWYPAEPFSMEWAKHSPSLSEEHREGLATLLHEQQVGFHAGDAALANVEKLRDGAAAVVTGQQVGLFGGPLLTLLKAATAVRKAQDATAATGREHVPVFWLATEDHDVAEVDRVTLLGKQGAETRGADLHAGSLPVPVGGIATGVHVEPALAWAEELLAFAPICEELRAAYTDGPGYEATLASGFGRLLAHIFREQGLIVMDASSRGFHALGAATLRGAIVEADSLQEALLARSEELVAAGYHAQVLVQPKHSLLFLITVNAEGIPVRQPLRREGDTWKAGAQAHTTGELLAILDAEPERLSPNALLRPVFQDEILPTAAYIAGPAEVAYFAQSEVLYTRILGRVTPVLPRLSATLVEPAVAALLQKFELQLEQVFAARSAEELAVRLGARSMPIEGKQKIAAAGNALDAELTALTEYMSAMSAELGRSAAVSASKMRYQMNRLRRMAASFEVQRSASLEKQACALMMNLFPEQHVQERLLAGVWFAGRYGDGLAQLLVDHAGQECPGHRLIFL